jgi:PEP-CTERM/exosortase A-associated glycosyltransferase
MPREALRILHVLDHSLPHHSGYSFRTLSLLRAQRALGWHTFHLTSPKQGASAAEEEAGGLHFYRTPAPANPPIKRPPWWHEAALMHAVRARLMAVAARVKPHLLQVHSPVLNALPALYVARALKVPLVYEIRALWEDAAVDHGHTRPGALRYRLTRALETFAAHRADHVTTLCRGLADELASRGLPRDKITVIPNAVDITAFTPGGAADETLKAQLGLAGKKVIGFIGSFYAYEGLNLLVEAFARVRQVASDVALLLAGGGPEEAALREQVRAAGLQEAVVFAGRVPHESVGRYYDLIDLLVYPRLPMRLTELVTPLKPLEAMAQGRAVLASDVGGHRELIEHALTGWLFEAGSVEALAHALLERLRAPDEGGDVRARARRFVENRRTWQASVARYQPVFEALVGRH